MAYLAFFMLGLDRIFINQRIKISALNRQAAEKIDLI